MKEKKDVNEILLKVLFVLLILEVICIPLLVIAEVKRILPIIFFLIIPTLFALGIVYLSKSCMNSYENKKKKIIEKLNNQ